MNALRFLHWVILCPSFSQNPHLSGGGENCVVLGLDLRFSLLLIAETEVSGFFPSIVRMVATESFRLFKSSSSS